MQKLYLRGNTLTPMTSSAFVHISCRISKMRHDDVTVLCLDSMNKMRGNLTKIRSLAVFREIGCLVIFRSMKCLPVSLIHVVQEIR